MEMPIADVIDRYTILKLKMKKVDGISASQRLSAKTLLEKEFGLYNMAIEDFRKRGIVVEDQVIEKLYKINTICWDMESDIREKMDRILSLSSKEIEEVGRNALTLRDSNKGRVAIKNEISKKFNASTRTIEMSLAEVIERYVITKLKSERMSDLTLEQILNEKPLLEKNLVLYAQAMEDFRERRVEIRNEWIEGLYNIAAKSWDMETNIIQGKEKTLGLEEVGRRAMILRGFNKERIALKNEIAEKSKTGFKEVKILNNN